MGKHVLKIAISGIGNRALPKNIKDTSWLGWVEQIKQHDGFTLVGVHDISTDSLSRIVNSGYLHQSCLYTDFDQMLRDVSCDALLVCNPAQYHGVTIKKAIERGLNLLVEKPFVSDIEEGKEIIDTIEKYGSVVCIIQNWRYKDVGRILHKIIQDGMLGKVGHIFFRYMRDRENPKYPEYIFEENYPLLYAMGIHHLDLFRYILNDDFKVVSGHAFKPHWSLYKSMTGVNLFIEMKTGAHINYVGTISARNMVLHQESFVIEGEQGTVFNESQWLEPPLLFSKHGSKDVSNLTKDIGESSIREQYNKSDEFILNNFYNSIMKKEKPLCNALDGLKSVATIEACKMACEQGKSIFVDNLLI
ncbi:Oxidoreductase family, NAD-binding Rossmann fold domain protein [Candidatus Magnetobacterium bavaricum]|uniref:Oxidoreductase family, NAD-binding Rossmann fold domain protein n=1 Tax=Candidatus Magnetobacterium bavaricum TaxID=29290 RepID=A0A0F3GJH3_9BACT|nr:Oxidoreductase family, NAD-binding Rossmann fold domain protein [Candidatus Magnetobacterium bavaricum]